MLSEREGCEVLLRVFTQRGYRIQEDIDFATEGISFNADGWDPDSKVGYEYLTHEAGDYEDLTPEVLAVLERGMEEGKFHFLLIDETTDLTSEDLADAANQFLDQVETRHLSQQN